MNFSIILLHIIMYNRLDSTKLTSLNHSRHALQLYQELSNEGKYPDVPY